MKLSACCYVLLLCVLGISSTQIAAAQATGASDEVTKTNWQQHPKIKEVRGIVQTVKNNLSRGAYRAKTRKFDYCEPYEDAERTIAIEKNGRVRYYEKQAGSEDSALKWEQYYDEAGRLRFVFITGGAANGSELEHRIYFDERGKRIFEDHKYTKGEGYTFPEIWPDDQLTSKPSDAFAAKSPCPEIKNSPKSKAQSPRSKTRS